MFEMPSQKPSIIIAAVVAALVVSGVYTVIATHMIEFPIVKYVSQGSAGIDAVINVHGYVESNIKVSVSGSGTNLSVPVSIISRCFVTSAAAIQENASQQTIRIITTTIPGTYIEPCNMTEHVVFAGLKPYSMYNVSINGSESPYCPPGVFCPFFILRVQKSFDVETAANGSIINVTFGV